MFKVYRAEYEWVLDLRFEQPSPSPWEADAQDPEPALLYDLSG
jgi:hypothetical protein